MISHFGKYLTAVKIGLLVAVIGAIITIFMPNWYCSEATILPSDSKGSGQLGQLGQLAAAAANFGIQAPLSLSDSGDANFMDIAKSRYVLEDVLRTEFKFHTRSWWFGQEQTRDQTLYNYLKCKNMDRGIRKLRKLVGVSRDSKTKVLVLECETKSPDLSQMIAQKIIQNLERFVQTKSRTKGGEKARFSEARLKEARGEADKAEAEFHAFLEANRNYQSSADPTIHLRGLKLEAELRLRQQLVVSSTLSHEQALLEEKNDVPIVNILDAPNYPLEKSKPLRLVIIGLCFVLGFGVTCLWLFRDWWLGALMGNGSATATHA